MVGIIKNLGEFQKRYNNILEFVGIEALDIKFNLLNNLSDRGVFQLPEKTLKC